MNRLARVAFDMERVATHIAHGTSDDGSSGSRTHPLTCTPYEGTPDPAPAAGALRACLSAIRDAQHTPGYDCVGARIASTQREGEG